MQNFTKIILVTGGMLLLLADFAFAGDLFTPDSQPTGWLSVPAVSNFDVSSGTETFYQGNFFKYTYPGEVKALDINSAARIQSTGPWDELDPTETTTATIVDAVSYDTGRKIATLGRPFRWASLENNQRDAIGSEANLNFSRGDSSNEEPDGLSLRKRDSAQADSIHSNIVYWDHGSAQNLYVGGNDGMLHAFDANTGVEKWAYVPSMLIPKLADLAAKPYVHTHFVDGPIAIANFEISDAMKTILVGGLGAGGWGIYALDITSPSATLESDVAAKVLWELKGTNDPGKDKLGHVYGTPQFARSSDGKAEVFFSNGYMSKKGGAFLYSVDVITGSKIREIKAGGEDDKKPNGLSSPTLFDVNGDAVPEYAYAGDMDGQLWRFDLSENKATVLMTTSPAQPITTAPAVAPHPLGGQMIAFATGRALTSGDLADTSVHYAYGIWDGAPDSNDGVVTQAYTTTHHGSNPVRTVTNNALDWSDGNDKGWKIALQSGERVVGERPFYHNGRFYFTSTNPTVEGGENWLNELVLLTGGPPLLGPIFDLNEDDKFDDSDLAANGGTPVSKYLGIGVFSQPRLVEGDGLTTTLFAFHPDLPVIDGVVVVPPVNGGISNGHFDFDIFYYGPESFTTIKVPRLAESDTATICKKEVDVAKKLDMEDNLCKDNADITDGYTYLSDYIVGSVCKPDNDPNKVENYIDITCNPVDAVQWGDSDYRKVQHVHEYDDKYNVTGVNMRFPSDESFRLDHAIIDENKEFKILVMNQYLSPAVHLSVGGAQYESVITYGNLASEMDPAALLDSLPVYSRATINTFIYNLPLDAFSSKDWWGDGGQIRSGLIPTQTGCVNSVDNDGFQDQPGKFGERFNGSITFQLIEPDTPPEHLEFNGPDVTYGWRVKMEFFKEHVLAEWLSFWHHPNGKCYDDDDWVPDPPLDFDVPGNPTLPEPGTDDPTQGVVIIPPDELIVNIVTTVSDDGDTTTTVTTFADDSVVTVIVTDNGDDTATVTTIDPDGNETTETVYTGIPGGEGGFVDPNTGSPEEDLSSRGEGRQSWRDVLN